MEITLQNVVLLVGAFILGANVGFIVTGILAANKEENDKKNEL